MCVSVCVSAVYAWVPSLWYLVCCVSSPVLCVLLPVLVYCVVLSVLPAWSFCVPSCCCLATCACRAVVLYLYCPVSCRGVCVVFPCRVLVLLCCVTSGFCPVSVLSCVVRS